MNPSKSLRRPLLQEPGNKRDTIELQSRPDSSTEPRVPDLSPPQERIQTKKMKCAGCPITLSYPDEAYCVRCPQCQTTTAVVPLSKIRCPYCLTALMYPAGATYIRCTCGQVMKSSIR